MIAASAFAAAGNVHVDLLGTTTAAAAAATCAAARLVELSGAVFAPFVGADSSAAGANVLDAADEAVAAAD